MAEERWEHGLAAYASQFGVPPEQALDALRAVVGEPMASEAVRAAGAAWAPDHPLSPRERSLLVVAALAGQGGVEERLRRHVRWATEHDLTAGDLQAAVAFLAVYIGYPRASIAAEVIVDELGGPG
jgi:4-carboxymuconolactone decarboxylase